MGLRLTWVSAGTLTTPGSIEDVGQCIGVTLCALVNALHNAYGRQPAATATRNLSTRPASTISAATLAALTMAVADDDPWLMMHTPSTPSSIAPPVWSGSSTLYSGISESMAGSATAVAPSASNTLRTRVRSTPSMVFSTTLPVKPSATTTSTSSVMMSRPSTLPRNVAPEAVSAAGSASRPWVSLTRSLPLDDSSPIDSRPTRGVAMP